MKTDNLVLLESLFVPEYRHRLIKIFSTLEKRELPKCKAVMEAQVKDIKELEKVDLDVDYESFTLMILVHRKALLNRMRACKVLKEDPPT